MNTTTATERPILFSAAMVRAISAGTKTQTRRALKKQPPNGFKASNCGRPSTMCFHPDYFPYREGFGFDLGRSDRTQEFWPKVHERSLYCPYGQPGDRLWVRETFAHIYRNNTQPEERRDEDVAYKADHQGLDEYAYGTWKPSIHMPRWASRISLELTDVRIERLQDISEADAQAEGCAPAWLDANDNETVHVRAQPTYRQGFARLWRDINGPGSWEPNPWVWVVTFKRI